MSGVAAFVFGEPRLVRGDRVVVEAALGGRRGGCVLVRLLATPAEVVHRDHLAAAVWGDHPPASWRAALRNVIAGVRRGLSSLDLDGDQVLRTQGAGYLLDLPHNSTVDLDDVLFGAPRVEGLLQRGRVEAALAEAHRLATSAEGDLLPGIETPYVVDLRQRVLNAGLQLRLSCGRTAVVAGDPGLAEACAREVLRAAPLREDAHRLLIQALADGGNRAAAIQAYELCRQLLAETLGVNPAPETHGLFLELLSDDADNAGHERQPWSPLLGQRSSAFVGRTEPLALLIEEWHQAQRTGRTRAVDIVGEPGIGKTRLAAELTAWVRTRSTAVLYGRAEDRVDVPHRPVMEALETYLVTLPPGLRVDMLGRGAADLARYLPAVRDVVSPSRSHGIPDLDQLHLFEATREVITRLAGTDGALLVLDDVQWSPLATVALVEHLMTCAAPVLIVTLRRARAGTLWDEYAARADVTGLELLPLDAAEIDELARLSGRPEIAGSPGLLHTESGGNPLYATERLLLDEVLAADEASGAEPDLLPDRMRDLVRRRIATLPPAAGAVLSAAAVVGLEFDPTVVLAAVDTPAEIATYTLGIAERDGILVPAVSDPRRLSFRHALIRSALLADLDEATTMRLHRQVGEALEQRTHGISSSMAGLAHHFDQAAPLGEWRRAARYGSQVARAALDNLILDDAVDAADRALTVLRRAGDPDQAARIDLEIIRSRAKRLRGDADGAATAEATHVMALAHGDPVLIARAALAFSVTSAGGEDAYLDAARIEVYQSALDGLGPEDPRLQAKLLGCLASAYAWSADAAQGRLYADKAITIAREIDDSATLSSVLVNARRSLYGLGRGDLAHAREEELFALARDIDDPLLLGRTWMWRFETSMELGLGDDLDRALEAARPGITTYAHASDRWSLAYYQGARSLLHGQIDAADEDIEAARQFGHEAGVVSFLVDAVHQLQLIGVRYEQGRLAEIRDGLAAFVDGSGMAEWQAATAFVDGEIGNLDAVPRQLDTVFAGFAANGMRTSAGTGLAAYLAAPIARVHDSDKARLLYEMLAPQTGRGAAPGYLVCPMDWALGLCAAEFGDTDRARRHFEDSATFARSINAPLWVARSVAAAETGGLPPRH